jgi:trimethylamine---corrinoid protein Co-methyltransferase
MPRTVQSAVTGGGRHGSRRPGEMCASRRVCLEGPGHFLAARQTLERMQTDYVYPLAGDRTSPKEWIELGSTDVVERAARKAREILGSHYPAHIDPASDAFVRERLPIRLPREAMRPGVPPRKGAAA